MTPYEIAQSYIGTTEIPGDEDNPVIMKMYKTIHQEKKADHDEVAWCAAFVGHCLEIAGLRSTQSLMAKSYRDWGMEIEPADARPGDIVVFDRGKFPWQGHVGFFVKKSSKGIEVLGGNQRDKVKTQNYAVSMLLGVRRADMSRASMSTVKKIQLRLENLGYHEVGMIDGEDGPLTQAAIRAFLKDNNLQLDPVVNDTLLEALESALARLKS